MQHFQIMSIILKNPMLKSIHKVLIWASTTIRPKNTYKMNNSHFDLLLPINLVKETDCNLAAECCWMYFC